MIVIGCEADGVADDFWRDKPAIDLHHHDENHRDDQRVLPVAKLRHGDQHRGNPAEQNAEVRDELQDHHEQADEQREFQSHDQQRDSDERAVDDRHQNLPAKKRDEVAVDLCQARDDLVLEIRRAQRQIIAPSPRNRPGIAQEKKQIDGHDHQPEQKTENAEKAFHAADDEIPDFFRQCRQLLLRPAHDLLDCLLDVGIFRILRLIFVGKGDDVLLAAVHQARDLRAELDALMINLRDDPNQNPDERQQRHCKNVKHRLRARRAEADKTLDNWIEQIRKNRRYRDRNEQRLHPGKRQPSRRRSR